MKQLKLINLCFLMLLNFTFYAQDLSSIWEGVNAISLGGNIGTVSVSSTDAIPIAFSSPCDVEIDNFAVATEYQSGKVIVYGHEALVRDSSIDAHDNLTFVSNSFDWLASGNNKRISYVEGYVSISNTQTIQANLVDKGYSVEGSISGDITLEKLQDTDILILGNHWNGNSPYNQSEVVAIENFVADGGGLLVLGLGWSWPGSELDNYPMNQVANLFKVNYEKEILIDNIIYDFDIFSDEEQSCYPLYVGTNHARGETIRVLRLAISVAGEGTQLYGPRETLRAQMEDWLAGINEVFGREFAIRFDLVYDDALIFDDPLTDPWPDVEPGSGCGTVSNLIAVQKENFDNIIGADSYDISHVITELGGGCGGGFNSGVSGGFWHGVGRHEINHQFGAQHTTSLGRPLNYEFQQGGGWTIQGGNGNGYAHASTYHVTIERILRDDAEGIDVPTGNNPPEVDAGPDYTIPISTPFTLVGNASDVDSEEDLTYVWDNMNPWLKRTIADGDEDDPDADDTNGIMFSRFLPTASNQRTFPQISDVIANNDIGEYERLPAEPRVMDMRLTVNDNHKMNYEGEIINASGTNSDDVRITVAEAGPFVVTSQDSSGITYVAGSTQEVTWQVNGTDLEPINATNVKITLSYDGGYTYPVTLLENVPNNGQATIIIPDESTTEARIKVAAVGNVFFDINTQDFQIENIESCNWNVIANENDILNFTGTKTIRYGANGVYNIQTVSGGTRCSNSVFGDPIRGVVKTCEECQDTNVPYSTKIEAEDYDTMSGIQTQDTQNEIPQSLNVGWIDAGDWMDYTIDIPNSGTYTINARVATIRSSAEFQFQVNGTVLNTITMATTGGWQNWTTLSTSVNLVAGEQTLRIFSRGNNFNINWFEITNESISGKLLSLNDAITSVINVYPVPANSELNILKTLNDEMTLVEIVDLKGSVLMTKNFKEELTVIDISSFESGIYIARFYNEDGSIDIKKFIKE